MDGESGTLGVMSLSVVTCLFFWFRRSCKGEASFRCLAKGFLSMSVPRDMRFRDSSRSHRRVPSGAPDVIRVLYWWSNAFHAYTILLLCSLS